MSKDAKPAARSRPPRQAVLIVVDDTHLTAYGESNLDIHFARMPQGVSRDSEALADDVLYLSLQPKFRKLYRADLLRACGTTRPLSPSTALAARRAQDAVDALNGTPTRRRPKRRTQKRRRPLA